MNMKPVILEYLRNEIEPGSFVMDVGCGDKWYWPFIDAVFIGIDSFAKFKPSCLLDLNKDNLPAIEPDIVLMLDFIEHLPKERGKIVLQQARQRAKKKVIVYTPLFWDVNDKLLHNKSSDYYGNEHNLHKSLWTDGDFEGFQEKATFYGKFLFATWIK